MSSQKLRRGVGSSLHRPYLSRVCTWLLTPKQHTCSMSDACTFPFTDADRGVICLMSAKPDVPRSFELPSTRDFRWSINNNKHIVFIGARLCCNCFTYVNLFSPCNSPSVVGLRPLYKGRSRETERLSSLPKVTQLERDLAAGSLAAESRLLTAVLPCPC